MNRSLLTALLVLLMGFNGLLPAATAAQAVLADRIVAIVNNEVITATQLRDRVLQAERQLQRQGIELPPREVLEPQVLEHLIMERAQVQLAEASAIRVSEDMLGRAIGSIAQNNGISIEDMRGRLEQDGISWEKFRDGIRTEILLTLLREREVDEDVVVSNDEVDNFIENNPDAVSGVEYRLAHILLRTPENASPAQIQQARERAENVMRQLESGRNFAQVAAANSDASDSMEGGDLGWREINRLPPLFAEVARQMAPGEYSPPLQSAAGLHIILMLGKRGGDDSQRHQVEQTHARHILIKVTEIVSDADAEHRLLALRERAVQGGSRFEDLARAHSDDLSAVQGGDLGWLDPGATVPDFERAMNALAPNEISMPVRSPFGWHLIQVLERRMRDVTDERKRNLVRAALIESKAEAAYEDWLRQLRDNIYVEYRLDRE